MASQSIDVSKSETGKIWCRKPAPNLNNGVIVTISHGDQLLGNVRFLHAAFDSKGDRFIAGDHQGNVYSFDVGCNRYSFVKRVDSSCTAISFTLRRPTEFLVALANNSLKCFDTETKELVAWIKGHESTVQNISIHASGRYAITSSSDAAQLWDLDTFTRKRKLNIKGEVGIVKVFFIPLSNCIATCLKDDTIFIFDWDADNLVCKFQLPVPPGRMPQYRAFACTKDGRLLAAAGKSRFLHIWSLETRQLQRIVQMPAKVQSVKQLEFLNENFDRGQGQILGVLSQDGIMRFINTDSCKLLFDIGQLENKIHNCAVSPVGRHVAAVTERGTIDLYDVAALYADINRPPPPLMKVVEANQMHDQTISSHDTSASTRDISSGRLSSRKKDLSASKVGDVCDDTSSGGLDLKKLVAILKGFGEYPAKYRLFIWRSLLKLPENHAAYASLVDKGTLPAYALLHEHYPIKSRKLLRVLQRCLSALGHWSPIFGETDYLPMLAFPFVKLVQNNQLVCFEIIATLLTNWCQHWFEYFPNPPINILSMVENLLAHYDKDLLQHFVRHGVTSQIYAWPLLETLFSEVLTKDEWLRLFDHVFSNHPSFLLVLVVAYCITSRGPLMHSKELDDFKYFFHHRNACDLNHMIKEAYRINRGSPAHIHPKNQLESFKPLTNGQYPVFNKYPKFIVDYQVQERDRLRQEEIDYVKQRQMNLQMQEEVAQHRNAEEAWYRQQKLLLDAEEQRRKLIQDEEEKIIEQRSRLQALNRETRLKELQLLDAARRKFMGLQQQQKQVDLKRLDDELERKTRLRETETMAVIDEADLRNMELQVQRRMFEQEMERAAAEGQVKFKSHDNIRREASEVEEGLASNVNRLHDIGSDNLRREVQQRLAKTEQRILDVDTNNQMELRRHLDDLHKERELLRISRLHQQNMDLENQIHGLIRRMDSAKVVEADNKENEKDFRSTDAAQAARRRLDLVDDGVVDCGRNDRLSTVREAVRMAGVDVEDFGRTDRCRTVREDVRMAGVEDVTDDDDTVSTISSQISLDRNREELDREEALLLQEVCRIREKLARDHRVKSRAQVLPPRC